MTNTKFNVILIAIGISLLIVLFNVFYLYRRNEASKINFNDKYIKDTVWKSNDAKLSFNGNNLTFIINDSEKINSSYTLDKRSGKFNLSDDEEFYLRSINEETIIVWYNRAEYNLEKEVIAR